MVEPTQRTKVQQSQFYLKTPSSFEFASWFIQDIWANKMFKLERGKLSPSGLYRGLSYSASEAWLLFE